MANYLELLKRAQITDTPEDWAAVVAMEEKHMEERVPPSMREPEGAERRADYLTRPPLCTSCEARGLHAPATHVVYAGRPEDGDGEDNLAPICRISLYVLTARQMGWPIRGCDIGGYPNDPEHPWNASH